MGLEDTSDKYYILYIFTGLTAQMWQLFTFVLDVIFLFCFVCFLINVPPCSALGKQTIKPVVNLTLFSLMIAEKTAEVDFGLQQQNDWNEEEDLKRVWCWSTWPIFFHETRYPEDWAGQCEVFSDKYEKGCTPKPGEVFPAPIWS